MVLTQAARGLIRGDAGSSPAADQADDGGRIAALLCFDEMQITDVFTAVALKGACAVFSHSVPTFLRADGPGRSGAWTVVRQPAAMSLQPPADVCSPWAAAKAV